MRFSDFVDKAQGGKDVSLSVKAPNGTVKPTDVGQVTFEQTPSGDYCIESGGSHVRSHTPGQTQCFTITTDGATDYKVVRADAGEFWASGDAGRYQPLGKRGAADNKKFKASDISTITKGFNAIRACALADTASTATLEDVSAPGVTPGYGMDIFDGAGGYTGDSMFLPAGSPGLLNSSFVEGGRVYGIASSGYGGAWAGDGTTCPADFQYMIRAFKAGAR